MSQCHIRYKKILFYIIFFKSHPFFLSEMTIFIQSLLMIIVKRDNQPFDGSCLPLIANSHRVMQHINIISCEIIINELYNETSICVLPSAMTRFPGVNILRAWILAFLKYKYVTRFRVYCISAFANVKSSPSTRNCPVRYILQKTSYCRLLSIKQIVNG